MDLSYAQNLVRANAIRSVSCYSDRELNSHEVHRDIMAKVLVQQTIEMLKKVSEAEMGCITMFGVSALQTGSAVLDFTLKFLTLVALVSSVMLLADLALPFDGIMQVDTSIFSRTCIHKSISAVLVTASADASHRASCRESTRDSQNLRRSRISEDQPRTAETGRPRFPTTAWVSVLLSRITSLTNLGSCSVEECPN